MARLSVLIFFTGILVFMIIGSPGAYAAEGFPDIKFNIKDGEIVKLDDFFLVAELPKELLGKFDQFKMLVDGKDMGAKFLSKEGILTFLPGKDFDVGKHLIQIVGVKSGLEETLGKLGFGGVLKDLDKFISGEKNIEDAILALGGELVLDTNLNSLKGLGKDILIRDPGEALSQWASNIATDKWGIDINMLLDSTQGRYTQIYDRFKVAIKQENLAVMLGETFPKFSDFTISGRRLQGLSWSDLMGDAKFEGAWGQALRSVPARLDPLGGLLDKGTPGLDVYTFRVGTKDGQPLRAGVTLLGGNESNYGPDYSFPGDENRVMSFDAGYELGKNFKVNGEYAVARNRPEDMTVSQTGEAKRLSLNYETGDNKLSVAYRDVEPTFDSFGLNSVRTDVRGLKVDDRFSFAGIVTGNIGYEKFRDNLDMASPNPRWTEMSTGRLTFRPKSFPGGFDFNYRRFGKANDLAPEENGAYDISSDSTTFSGFVRGDFIGASHQLRVSYTDRSSDDAVHTTSGSDSKDTSLFWSMRFASGLGLSVGLGKQEREASGQAGRDSTRYDINFSYPFDNNRLLLACSVGIIKLAGDAISTGSDRLNGRLALNWRLTPYYSIEGSYQRLDYNDGGNDALDYTNDAFNCRILRSF